MQKQQEREKFLEETYQAEYAELFKEGLEISGERPLIKASSFTSHALLHEAARNHALRRLKEKYPETGEAETQTPAVLVQKKEERLKELYPAEYKKLFEEGLAKCPASAAPEAIRIAASNYALRELKKKHPEASNAEPRQKKPENRGSFKTIGSVFKNNMKQICLPPPAEYPEAGKTKTP